MNRLVALSLAAAALLMTGCPRGEQAKPQAAGEAPRASVALRLLVVNEPGLAEAINRLRGEWAEQSGGEFEATSKTFAQVVAGKDIEADAIVFPSRYLGEFGTRGWLRPVRAGVLESDEFKADDVFPLVRHELIKWDGQTMALPLGVNLPMTSMYETYPAVALINEAAPKVLTNEHEGVLFDSATMKPRITESTFVAALAYLPRRSYFSLAVSRDGHPIPVFGYADRMVGVTTSSRNAASAFKFITWLATAETSSQLASAGEGTLPVRRSLASSEEWYDSKVGAKERSEMAKSLDVALSGREFVVIPRIPGVDEYLAALDEAVRSVVSGKEQPQAALEKAATQWEKITDSHGRDSQRRAYLKHLGITEP